MRITIIILLILSICSCRTVKRNSSLTKIKTDSSSTIKTSNDITTVIKEKVDTQITFNPGNLNIKLPDPKDTCESVFETDAFKLLIKGGNLSIQGKDIKKDIKIDKETKIKDKSTINAGYSLNKDVIISNKDKKVYSGIPLLFWIFLSIGIGVGGYFLIKQKNKND